MVATDLLFQTTKAEIGVVTLDASLKESHTATSKLSRHPIEAETGSQSEVSDNIQVDPVSVQIEGIVTNTPVEWLSVAGKDYAQEAHQELLDTLLSGRLVTIVTSLLEYPNMVLESLSVTRDANKANALYLTATATMARLVTLEEVAVARPVQKATKKSGKKKKTEAASAKAEKSITVGRKWLGL